MTDVWGGGGGGPGAAQVKDGSSLPALIIFTELLQNNSVVQDEKIRVINFEIIYILRILPKTSELYFILHFSLLFALFK